MKSILRTTVILGSSTLITVIISLISSKLWAILLGPKGFGLLGLLQNTISFFVLITGLGIGTGFVRLGSAFVNQEKKEEIASLRMASWILYFILTFFSVLLIIFFRKYISKWFLGDIQNSNYILILSLALPFSLATTIHLGILNSFHRVGHLAKYAIVSSLAGFFVSAFFIFILNQEGIIFAVAGNAIVDFVFSLTYQIRGTKSKYTKPNMFKVWLSFKKIIGFGIPYTCSMLVGTGVQLILPLIIIHKLGTESVGYYKAATTISLGYLTFLLNALSQDYYPRVCILKDQPKDLIILINEQNKFILLLVLPLILLILTLTPFIIPLLYSEKFIPAAKILGWQLIGDLFKLSSFTMSFVILAKSRSLKFFIVELFGGVGILLSNWFCIEWLGLEGVGVSFLLSYLFYFLIVWSVVRNEINFLWSKENIQIIIFAIVLTLTLRLLPVFGLESYNIYIGISFSIMALSIPITLFRSQIWNFYLKNKKTFNTFLN